MTKQAEPMQPDHLLVAAATLLTSLRPQPLHACDRRRRGHHGRGGVRGDRAGGLPHRAAMPIHHTLQGFAEIVEEMPPIRDLESIGCPLPGRLGIGASTIARDDLDAFMMLQPIRNGGGLAVGQQVDDGVALEVDQDGSVVLATLPSPLINPHHPQRRMRWSLSATNQPQQCIGTERHGQAGSKTRARFAAEAQAKLALDTGQPRCTSCRAGGTLTQRIGEGPPCTSGIAAQETAHANQQCCRTPLTRQVLQSALIGRMNAARGLATSGTVRGGGLRCGDDGYSIGRWQDLLNGKVRRDQGENVLRQENPAVTNILTEGVAAAPLPLPHTKCGRTLAWRAACGRTCFCACWPTTSNGTCASAWRRCCSTTPIRRRPKPGATAWWRRRSSPR